MSFPAAITETALQRILGFLAPLFLMAEHADPSSAREAARELLLSYDVRTNKELRLAALAIAFSFGALDSLSRSVTADLSVNQVLRLRGSANALHRAAHKSQDALDRLQQADPEPTQQEATQPESADDLPASVETPDLVAFTRPVQLSRQQRRAAERQAEKIRIRKQEEARRAARAAARTAASHRAA